MASSPAARVSFTGHVGIHGGGIDLGRKGVRVVAVDGDDPCTSPGEPALGGQPDAGRATGDDRDAVSQ
jgi:hypothetical protein